MWLILCFLFFCQSDSNGVSPSAESRTTSEDRLKRASELIDQNKFNEAVQELTSCLNIDPKNSEARQNRALLHLKVSNHSAAVEDLTVLIESDPEAFQGQWMLLRGISYSKLGEHENAIADMNRYCAANPRSSDAIFFRARVLIDAGREAAALREFDRLVAANPLHADILAARGRLKVAMDRVLDGLVDLKRADSLSDGTNAEILTSMSVAYYYGGEYEESRCKATQAIAVEQHYAQAFAIRTLANIKLGRLVEARADLEMAASIDPDNQEYKMSIEDIIKSGAGKEQKTPPLPSGSVHFIEGIRKTKK